MTTQHLFGDICPHNYQCSLLLPLFPRVSKAQGANVLTPFGACPHAAGGTWALPMLTTTTTKNRLLIGTGSVFGTGTPSPGLT